MSDFRPQRRECPLCAKSGHRINLHSGTGSEFNHRDERNQNENRQHDDVRDRER
jgi:hypothetical protein